MIYFIKNMVCQRCIMVVADLFNQMGCKPLQIKLGEVETSRPLNKEELELLKSKLIEVGFELLDDHRSQLIEKIKNTIIQLIHYTDKELKVNYSEYIETHVNKDYAYLSNLFSELEGTTIEKYIINQKIERVKELLVYDELTLSEIANKMGYSNVAYLSSQFKKVTGLTPTHFKNLKEMKRRPLDQV